MEAYEVSSFARLDNSQLGQGQTTSYTNRHGEQLAYVDYNHDRTEAAVVVFTPYNDGQRSYSRRPVERAEAIAAKHLAKLGYVAPEFFEDKRVTPAERAEQQINEQWHDFTEEDDVVIVGENDGEIAVGIDDDTIIVAQKHSDGSTRIVSELKGYAPISEAELDEVLDRARAEKQARETLCELTPAQKSGIAAAIVWP